MGFLNLLPLKCFSTVAVQVKTEHLSMVRLCFPSQQKCDCIYGVLFNVQNSNTKRPSKGHGCESKWIFLLKSVASDYNGDSSDSIQ